MELHEQVDWTYEGDVLAFGELVSRYRDMAFGYALTIVDRDQTAEDAVQEAIVLAYSNLDRLREPRAFGAWLRGIVRHQCYRALRTERPSVSWDATLEVCDDRPDPSHVALQSEIWDQVRNAIQALPSELRELVHLHYEAGLSQQEIASQLGLTAGAVNMRLHSARSRLRRRLMTDNTNQTINLAENPGRIQEVNGQFITVQFAPNATPPILSRLTGHGDDALCVVQHLSAGRVIAVRSHLGSIWTPGQEVADTGQPHLEPLNPLIVEKVVDGFKSAKSGTPLPTGIKTIDVFAPLTQSGTVGIFTEWGLGVLVLLPELIHHLDKDNNRQTILVFIPPVADAQHWNELTAEITKGTTNLSILYLPVADPVDLTFRESVNGLDSSLVLSRHLAEQAIWPCIDPLVCRSRRLDEALDDPMQSTLVSEVQELLRTYYALQFSIDDTRRHTLSCLELDQIKRARKALRYLAQPFFVAEPYTKRPGESVEPEEARRGFVEIVAGRG